LRPQVFHFSRQLAVPGETSVQSSVQDAASSQHIPVNSGESAGSIAAPVYASGLSGVLPAYRAGAGGAALIHRYQLHAVTFELVCQQIAQLAEGPLTHALVLLFTAILLTHTFRVADVDRFNAPSQAPADGVGGYGVQNMFNPP